MLLSNFTRFSCSNAYNMLMYVQYRYSYTKIRFFSTTVNVLYDNVVLRYFGSLYYGCAKVPLTCASMRVSFFRGQN